ncbi:uncharacterized protein LOC132684654 [Panthera onca]
MGDIFVPRIVPRERLRPERVRGSLPETRRNWKEARGGYIPFLGRTWTTLNLPSPTFPPGSSFVVKSFDKWWGRERGEPGASLYPRGGQGPGLATRFPPALSPKRRGVGSGTCPPQARPLLSNRPIPLSPFFCFSPTPHRYRELSGNRRDFSAVCAACIRINSALRHPAGNGSRFECTQMHRPSTGLGVAPGDHAAALDYQRSQPGSCPSLPGSARQPPPLVMLRPSLGRVRPRRKLKANSSANDARTFFDASLTL